MHWIKKLALVFWAVIAIAAIIIIFNAAARAENDAPTLDHSAGRWVADCASNDLARRNACGGWILGFIRGTLVSSNTKRFCVPDDVSIGQIAAATVQVANLNPGLKGKTFEYLVLGVLITNFPCPAGV